MVETVQVCRHCSEQVRRMDGPALTPDESSLARVVHEATGRERCADWRHVAAPADPGMTLPVREGSDSR
jgi:hypothetical protein